MPTQYLTQFTGRIRACHQRYCQISRIDWPQTMTTGQLWQQFISEFDPFNGDEEHRKDLTAYFESRVALSKELGKTEMLRPDRVLDPERIHDHLAIARADRQKRLTLPRNTPRPVRSALEAVKVTPPDPQELEAERIRWGAAFDGLAQLREELMA